MSDGEIDKLVKENKALRAALVELAPTMADPKKGLIEHSELEITERVQSRLLKRLSFFASVVSISIVIASIGGYVSLEGVIEGTAKKIIKEKTGLIDAQAKSALNGVVDAESSARQLTYQLEQAKSNLTDKNIAFEKQFTASTSELKKQESFLSGVSKKIEVIEARMDALSKKLSDLPNNTKGQEGEISVDLLIRDEKYEEVLEIDPDNTIALMRYGEQLVDNARYSEAVKLYKRLSSSSRSGVQYSSFPSFIQAFERIGKETEALQVIESLRNQIIQERGYTNSAQTLTWIKDDLVKVEKIVESNNVKMKTVELVQLIESRIKSLLQLQLKDL